MVDNKGAEGYNSLPTIKKKTGIMQKQAGGMMFWQFAQDAPGSLSLLSDVNEGVVKYDLTGIPSIRPVAVSKSAGNGMLWSGRGGMSLGISGDLGPESRFDPAGRRLHGMQLTAVPAGKTAP